DPEARRPSALSYALAGARHIFERPRDDPIIDHCRFVGDCPRSLPLEQLLSQILFERADLMADGRLTNIELFGRPAETPQPHAGFEDTQRFQGGEPLHVPSANSPMCKLCPLTIGAR